MLDETTDRSSAPAPLPGRGNGAPAWLDAATIARYTHYSRLPLHAMVGLDAELALVLDAHFVGCTPEQLRDIRAQHARAVAEAAAQLLADEGFAADLDRVPAATGQRVVVLGDSITADSLGWATLLAACLDALPGGAPASVANLAVSAATTNETIAMFDLAVRERPTCVITMLGTNDGRRQGAVADVRTVSPEETRRNMLALKALAEQEAQARFVALAPPPMDDARYEATAPDGAPTRFSSADLEETLAALAAALPDLVGPPVQVEDSFWLPDGVHPTLEGQVLLVRHVVRALATLGPVS
ncbi:acyl-CoA thioesterase-1 [Motilibacter peucedani]|uniref:Acyl-CoA thioesterase-1 n=1 Tax=Motilibacter peucedani TaxID=598650 RepID=A0A420XQH1_9ACTN|nr:GDSL-type esterase/lipase family protein [Motilibacter peucedani]RKS75551.1 acyl-CoA thioesterase-1 [Motilibacter peucedani]